MGYPMAGHLQNSGMEVCVYNRTAEKAQRWVEEFAGSMAETPAAAAAGCDVVLSCVGNDDDVRQVLLGEAGALSAMNAGALLVDHTTASATLARELSVAAAECGVGFLDAPVSGGQAGAENGALTVMVGGEQGHYETARQVFESSSKFSILLAPACSGQLPKMVNHICIAGGILSFA